MENLLNIRDMHEKCNLAIFASGTGSNFINIYNNIINGKINANLNILISNNPNCQAVNFAKNNGINYSIINKFRCKSIMDEILDVLNNNNIHLVLLAGYMKKIPEVVVNKYSRKIINIHPALLPKFGGAGFYGMNIHEAVIKNREKETGITIHFVDNDYDTGEIIYQEKIKVKNEDSPDTLAKRVLELEHKIYPEIVRQFCDKYKGG